MFECFEGRGGTECLNVLKEVCHTVLSVLDICEISKSAAIQRPEWLPHRRGQWSESDHGTGVRLRKTNDDCSAVKSGRDICKIVLSRVLLIQINKAGRDGSRLNPVNPVPEFCISAQRKYNTSNVEC